MDKPPTSAKKSYRLFFDKSCNAGKIKKLEALYAVYLSYVSECLSHIQQTRTLVSPMIGTEETKSLYFLPSPAELNVGYRNCARNDAYYTVHTWIRTVYEGGPTRDKKKKDGTWSKKSVKAVIKEMTCSDELREELFTIGKYPTKLALDNTTVSDHAKDIFWGILLNEDLIGAFPTRKGHAPLQVSVLLANVFPAKNTQYPLWLSLSTLEKGKRTAFPLVPNPNIPDVSKAKVYSLGKDVKGRWFVNMLVEVPPVAQTATKQLGVDVGLNTFVATSDGWRWGEGAFKKKFLALRERILAIRRRRQKQGMEFYSDSKRLRVLEARLTGLIKSYAGRATNLLVQHHPDTTFVIEALNLQGTPGQKRFGYRIIHKCLAAKAPILEVNPAYTSQTCPHCGYVHSSNRRTSIFKCRACGKQLHADTVGAINVLGRSKTEHIDNETSVEEARKVLRLLYWNRRNPTRDCPEDFLKALSPWSQSS